MVFGAGVGYWVVAARLMRGRSRGQGRDRRCRPRRGPQALDAGEHRFMMSGEPVTVVCCLLSWLLRSGLSGCGGVRLQVLV